MARLMSVSLTADAVVERRKTVTRRLGWTFLKAGDRLTLCRKVMGRRKGEPLERLAEVEVVSVTRGRLNEITTVDVILEGFPAWTAIEFIRFFTETHKDTHAGSTVTRIEWRYLSDAEVVREALDKAYARTPGEEPY